MGGKTKVLIIVFITLTCWTVLCCGNETESHSSKENETQNGYKPKIKIPKTKSKVRIPYIPPVVVRPLRNRGSSQTDGKTEIWGIVAVAVIVIAVISGVLLCRYSKLRKRNSSRERSSNRRDELSLEAGITDSERRNIRTTAPRDIPADSRRIEEMTRERPPSYNTVFPPDRDSDVAASNSNRKGSCSKNLELFGMPPPSYETAMNHETLHI